MSDFYVMMIQFLIFIVAVFILAIVIFAIVTLAKNFINFRRRKAKQIDIVEENQNENLCC